jgi:hypothetical protein
VWESAFSQTKFRGGGERRASERASERARVGRREVTEQPAAAAAAADRHG